MDLAKVKLLLLLLFIVIIYLFVLRCLSILYYELSRVGCTHVWNNDFEHLEITSFLLSCHDSQVLSPKLKLLFCFKAKQTDPTANGLIIKRSLLQLIRHGPCQLFHFSATQSLCSVLANASFVRLSSCRFNHTDCTQTKREEVSLIN